MIERFALHVLVCYTVFVNVFPSRYRHPNPHSTKYNHSKDINLKTILLFVCLF